MDSKIIPLILTIIIVIIVIYLTKKDHKYQYKTFYQCTKGDSTNKLAHYMLKNSGIIRTDNQDGSDIIFACNSKYSEKYLKSIKITNPYQIVGFVYKNGILGSKQTLWKVLESYYGRDKASTIMPPSYIFPKDDKLFKKTFDSSKTYVLKSEKQRQQGISLTSSYDDVVNSKNNGFVVVQQYIDNPLTYHGYKLNFRVYLIVVCEPKQGVESAYIFDDGIVSYTKSKVGKKIDNENGIASFYTSKQLYEKGFPITTKKLFTDFDTVSYNELYTKFADQTKLIIDAVRHKLGSHPFKYNNKSFQIFGIDFIITNDGLVYVLEINIGPGMDPYNSEDRLMREKLHHNMYCAVGILNEKSTNLIKIY